jgi:iron complex outermembrane recepter protein
MRSTKHLKSLLALAIATAPLAFTATADTSFVLEEIVVTAQKRSESLQDVPIALSAFTGDFIKETKLTDVKQLVAFTPGLAGQSSGGSLDSISVRGVSTNAFGIGGDSSIGIYKDGIYYGRNGAAVTSFFDVERVEVLKGPQGLLFGRNAASGAIHTITAKPTTELVEGYVRVGAGERGRKQVEFAYNQPLSDTLAMRIAGVHSQEDGFVKNLYNGEDLGDHDRDAVRLSIKKEADWGDVTLTAEHEDRQANSSIYIAQDADGKSFTGDDRTANSDFPGKDNAKVTGVTLTANIDLSDTMTLTSISGYNKHDWLYREDWDGSPDGLSGWMQDQSGEYYSQEVRINVEASESLTWYVGASAYKEDISALLVNDAADVAPYLGLDIPFPIPVYESNYTEGAYSGWAVYGDMTYRLTEKMDVSVGARYTVDEKEAVTEIQGQGLVWPVVTPTPVKGKQDWSDFSPRITLRYFTDHDMMLFGSVSQGYKAGGFATDDVVGSTYNPGADIFVADDDATLDGFEPETILSYEIGAKGDLADGTIKYGVSAYYYNYEDLQTVILEVGKAVVENIGEADGMGVELDLRAAINTNWDLFLGAAWSDTDVSGLPLDVCVEPSGSSCSGNRLAFNPEWTVSGGINAHYPLSGGEVYAGLDFTWQSDYNSELANAEVDAVDGVAFVNLRTGWSSEQNWNLSIYVENIFDEESFSGRSTLGGIAPVNLDPAKSRTAGVDISYNF